MCGKRHRSSLRETWTSKISYISNRPSPSTVLSLTISSLDNHRSGYEGPTQYFGEVNQGHSTSGARLPVFCVSSKAYTIIHGIGQDAGSVDGFEHEKHTEIPQLAQYAIELTRKGRIWRARRFLTNVLELQTSLQIWSSDESWQARLTQAEDRRHQLALQHAVSEMKTVCIISLLATTCKDMR